MAKGMWVRCPQCGEWCYAEKKGFFGRLVRSIKSGDKECGDVGGELADWVGMKGLGKTAGRAVNALNVYRHGGELLNGDNYRFYCSNSRCGNEFGTDDESVDMSEEHELWTNAIKLRNNFITVKNQSSSTKRKYFNDVNELLQRVENACGISDAEAVLHDTAACCSYFFERDSKKALVEINRSLRLFDDTNSHVLKGLFMGKVSTPVENYEKMGELLYINDVEGNIPYVEREVICDELESAEKQYVSSFQSIPDNQRKFVAVTPEYSILPKSFKVIKYNHTDMSGIMFGNGYPNNNAIYVGHPYAPNIYYLSETYQKDLFQNQLNELRELLQCLGAKAISTKNKISAEYSLNENKNLNGKVSGEYNTNSANASGEHKTSASLEESMIEETLISDGFSFNPEMSPFVPAGLLWYDHMEEWQRISRMRLRGQDKLTIKVNTSSTCVVNDNEANQVNADFKAMAAKGNLEISQKSELKASEKSSHEWEIDVDFYPMTDYTKRPEVPKAIPQNFVSAKQKNEGNTSKLLIYGLVGVVLILVVVIVLLLL